VVVHPATPILSLIANGTPYNGQPDGFRFSKAGELSFELCFRGQANPGRIFPLLIGSLQLLPAAATKLKFHSDDCLRANRNPDFHDCVQGFHDYAVLMKLRRALRMYWLEALRTIGITRTFVLSLDWIGIDRAREFGAAWIIKKQLIFS
jgi:hypothetical protein